MLNLRLFAFSSLGFVAGGVFAWYWTQPGVEVVSRKDHVKTPAQEVSRRADSRDPLGSVFLLEPEWAGFLEGKSADEISQLIRERPAAFWKSHSLGLSAAYRLFGSLARVRPDSAFDDALTWSSGDGMPPDDRMLCTYWALVGVFENHAGLRIEDCLAKSPRNSWPTVSEALIAGSETVNLQDDLSRIRAAYTSLTEPAEIEKNKKELDQLLRRVVLTWTRRQPAAVLEWLGTKEGEPYRNLMSRLLAEISVGDPAVLAKFAVGENPVPIPDLANACYEGEWDIERVRALVHNLPEASRGQFLKEYCGRLAEGSPLDILSFVNRTGPDFLIPAVARALAPKVLIYSPDLFDKLAVNMRPEGRNKLLDDVFEKYAGGRSDPTAFSRYYLNKRGIDSPKGVEALGLIAYRDLKEALGYVAQAPKEQEGDLIASVYRASVSKLTVTGASTDEVLAFLESAPATVAQSIAETAIGDIAGNDPRAALELLDRFSNASDRMRAVFFERANLSADELNDLLGKALRNSIDPSVFSAAASRITDLSAREDLESAQQTVELLPDSPAKDECTATLLRRWGQVDPLGAVDYVKQLPSGPRRDAALRALLPHLSFAPEQHQQLLELASSSGTREAIAAEADKRSLKLH
jgi:hypothetical protein